MRDQKHTLTQIEQRPLCVGIDQSGLALMQALLLAAIVAGFAMLSLEFTSLWKRNSAKIIDRTQYVDLVKAKAQHVDNPSVPLNDQQLLLNSNQN